MIKLQLGLLGFLSIISFIVGINGSYLLCIIAFLIILSLLGIALFKKQNSKAAYSIFGIGLLVFLFALHFGILIRINLWRICTDIPPKDRRESEYNIRPITLDEVEKEVNTYSDLFEKEQLAVVSFKDSIFPINILTPRTSSIDNPNILILSGVHGSEPAGVFASLEILKTIRQKNLSEYFNFSFVYAVNPVGLNIYNRFNECNCDINRDFRQLNSVQARAIRKLVTTNDFDYVLDLHEGPYKGQYILDNTSFSDLKERLVERLNQENIIISPMMHNWLQEQLFLYQLDSPVKHIDGIMCLDHLLDSLNIENIVSESDIVLPNMEKRILGHQLVFESLIEALEKDK